MRKILPFLLGGLAAGIALGLLIGWQLWPVQYTDTSPAQLRPDYANDYVLMVATAYQVEGNLGAVHDRLRMIDPDQPGRPVVTLAEELIAAGGRQDDVAALVDLAQALEMTTPAMAPYLEEP